ncbi:uncharacterized protein HMPREF1120_04997 [Exophiala dermatitidis NIH/UT8656]|uniref:Uncharacterized protein n=1 Tax=Exophiala dermatitidis (strain ATCC 34100 / CBS 525.76 / NIH/UT8656) TaxID=858893 RepID=H6BZ70_EXODN|nr:uncharacterized protein HMPREF1120_04997 [Exophiala dermatitidis NIH/UT8656]EHY56933.1 hypothetical protein HMPREF1120_04997 [Exophiala dermatitidis NIH/UT8656]KAJ4514363.1 hypothetical protein HRR73_005389 [Exophiala dermatitidis]KAJ4604668.1 hypothetical protein HRR84_001749 [Exophiala dermatitidis]
MKREQAQGTTGGSRLIASQELWEMFDRQRAPWAEARRERNSRQLSSFLQDQSPHELTARRPSEDRPSRKTVGEQIRAKQGRKRQDCGSDEVLTSSTSQKSSSHTITRVLIDLYTVSSI